MKHSVSAVSILVVDDDRGFAEFIGSLLAGEPYHVTLAFSFIEAKTLLAQNEYTIVLSDVMLGVEKGMSLSRGTFAGQKPIFIFITGNSCMETAVGAIHEGAFDYLPKSFDLDVLEREVKSTIALAIKHLESNASHPKAEAFGDRGEAATLVGTSPQMSRVYRAIARASLSRGNVIITGESGTGKELVARAIHEQGPWAKSPFVTVNCGALTDSLLESELFGHVKGAFTGALVNKRGLFEEAHGGSIFLDEIGDVSPALQVKLLRAIQEGEIRPVGSSEVRRIDIRVIAATHRNLLEMVRAGQFREDLYYRLKVLSVELPALRERREDIPELAQRFLNRAAAKSGKNVTRLSDEAIQYLVQRDWPGNVRELENAVVQAVAVARSATLFVEDFPPDTVEKTLSASGTAPRSSAEGVEPFRPSSLRDLERGHIVRTLELTSFNKTKAAQLLGIDRVTLYRKMIHYGLADATKREAGVAVRHVADGAEDRAAMGAPSREEA